jgi:hypothetical protein
VKAQPLLPVMLLIVLASGVALGLPILAESLRPAGQWTLRAVEWVPAAASGQPLVAFADARCEACDSPMVQLRVCRADGTGCDVAARRPPNPDGVTRLGYGRPLEAGRYRVEILFLQRDAWSVLRTTLRAQGWVDVD